MCCRLSTGIFLIIMLCHKGSAIQCMNCSSDTLSPTVGCHDDFSDEKFLVDCGPEATHCRVERYEGSFGNSPVISYGRQCTNEIEEKCVMVNNEDYDGVRCIFTCGGDACNAVNVFPNEPEFTTPIPPTTTPTTAQLNTTRMTSDIPTTAIPERRLYCYNCSTFNIEKTPGCYEPFSDDFLILCEPGEYCAITRESTPWESETLIGHSRYCSKGKSEGCLETDYDYIVTEECFHTCETDACNTLDNFSNEPVIDDPVKDEENGSTGKHTKVTSSQNTEAPRKRGLMCYVCTTAESDDCLNEPSDEFLVECEPNDHCVVSKNSIVDEKGSTQYNRHCYPVWVENCKKLHANISTSAITLCSYSCDTDRCNDINLFPYEEGYLAANATTEQTTTTSGGISQYVSATSRTSALLLCFIILIKNVI